MSGEEAVPEPFRRKLAELRARNSERTGDGSSELLPKKAREYELLAASYSERAAFDAENGRAAVGFTLAALVLRELAEVLDEAA